MGDLKQTGIKGPETIGTPSVRNDAAFLFTTVGVTSVLAVILGQLPGARDAATPPRRELMSGCNHTNAPRVQLL